MRWNNAKKGKCFSGNYLRIVLASTVLRLAGERVLMCPWHVSTTSEANVLITDKGGKIPIHVGDC